MFNNGKPYHGSEAVIDGKLKGATDTSDYFYFFCPHCPDQHIVRILDYTIREHEAQNPYNKSLEKTAKQGFTLALQLYCEECEHTDIVKISNMGWQGGTHSETLRKEAEGARYGISRGCVL